MKSAARGKVEESDRTVLKSGELSRAEKRGCKKVGSVKSRGESAARRKVEESDRTVLK